MRDKSSSREPRGKPWHRVRLWWPVERVPVLLEIMHPRKLTALEWAVLRVMDEFQDDPPGREEVAEELGIADAAFLEDTLREVVRLRALESRTPDTPEPDLPDLVFTPRGQELFHRGRIETESAEHGEYFHFDAITDEACPAPKNAQDWSDTPFPTSASAPQPRQAVGLDRARDIVGHFHADLRRGDGEIRNVQPQTSAMPRIVWAPTDLELRICDQGKVDVRGASLTPAARAFLLQCEPLHEGIVPRASATRLWAPDTIARCSSNLTFATWCGKVSRTLASADVEQEVLAVLDKARREALVHAGWYTIPAVKERIAELAQRGAKVAIINAAEKPMLAAVVVDGRAGVLVDDVELHYGQHRPVVELAGVLVSAAAEQIRARFLQATWTVVQIDNDADKQTRKKKKKKKRRKHQ